RAVGGPAAVPAGAPAPAGGGPVDPGVRAVPARLDRHAPARRRGDGRGQGAGEGPGPPLPIGGGTGRGRAAVPAARAEPGPAAAGAARPRAFAPEGLRGWEWRHLPSRLDDSSAAFLTPVWTTWFLPGGVGQAGLRWVVRAELLPGCGPMRA